MLNSGSVLHLLDAHVVCQNLIPQLMDQEMLSGPCITWNAEMPNMKIYSCTPDACTRRDMKQHLSIHIFFSKRQVHSNCFPKKISSLTFRGNMDANGNARWEMFDV